MVGRVKAVHSQAAITRKQSEVNFEFINFLWSLFAV